MKWTDIDNFLHYLSLICDDTLTGKNLLPLGEQILSVRLPSQTLGANCSHWNVDYLVHLALLCRF